LQLLGIKLTARLHSLMCTAARRHEAVC
jgi:hypothetical protein